MPHLLSPPSGMWRTDVQQRENGGDDVLVRARVQAIDDAGAGALGDDQPTLPEQLQVAGERGLGERELRGDVAGREIAGAEQP